MKKYYKIKENGAARELPKSFAGSLGKPAGSSLGVVLELPVGRFLGISGSCPGAFSDLSGRSSGAFRELPRSCRGGAGRILNSSVFLCFSVIF